MSLSVRLRQAVYRYRSYSPLPFAAAALLFAAPTAPGMIAGSVLVAGGELIRIWSVSVAGGETRSTRVLAARRLVTSGPFAWTRNPIYLGNLLIYFGIGLMSMALFPWLLLAGMVWFTLQYGLIVAYEEEYLSIRFGRDYERYRSEVPRFFPRLRGFGQAGVGPPLRNGLRSERRTLQAEAAVMGILVLIYLSGVIRG